MRVRVYQAGKDRVLGEVDLLGARGRSEVYADGGDFAVGDHDARVGDGRLFGVVDQLAAADEDDFRGRGRCKRRTTENAQENA
ncbi:MAG TPA: hypothetical protein VMF66_12320 [Candidatus Acidoferrum sp.]|nr:hypothetical protein [Candidatus Acidoferrum sp.]